MAEKKIDHAVQKMKQEKPSQDGIGFWNHMAGLFGEQLRNICDTTIES